MMTYKDDNGNIDDLNHIWSTEIYIKYISTVTMT